MLPSCTGNAKKTRSNMFVNLRQSGQPAIQQAVQPAIPQAVQRGGLRSSHFFRNGIIKDSPILSQWLVQRTGGQAASRCTLRRPTWHASRAHEEIAVCTDRNHHWDLSAAPIGPVGEKVIEDYWGLRLHKCVLAVLSGVMAGNEQAPGPYSTHRQGDLLYDVSCTAYVAGITNINVLAILDTLFSVGKTGITDMVVHSKVFDEMLYKGMVDVQLGVGQFFQNLRITVDDCVPNPSPSVFDTYFFGPGFLEFGEATPMHSRQYVNRQIGPVTVYDRVCWSVHPMGHGFQGQFANAGGPTNLELAHPSSWRRTAALREHIPFACLRTREF